jgi:hypothetical protein
MELVHFIRPKGEDGPINIGSSSSPSQMLAILQAGNPAELELWGTVDAGSYPESHWHEELSPWRVREGSPWYDPSAQVLCRVEDALSGRLAPVVTFDPLEDREAPQTPPERVPGRFQPPAEPPARYAWPEVDPYPRVRARPTPASEAAPTILTLLGKLAPQAA